MKSERQRSFQNSLVFYTLFWCYTTVCEVLNDAIKLIKIIYILKFIWLSDIVPSTVVHNVS